MTGKPQARPGEHRAGTDAVVVALGYLSSFAYPLVALPFLARALGAPVLGALMVVLAVLQLIVYVTDYGFSQSALRRVVTRDSDAELGQIIGSTLTAKLLLLAGCAVVLLAAVAAVPGMRSHWGLYLLGLALVAAGTLFPDWLLQGLGRFTAFSALLACGRLVALAGLLATVRGPGDVAWALTWQVVPLGLSALGAWLVLARAGQARWTAQTRSSVGFALADGKHLFVGNIAHMSMGAVNTVVLGALAGPVQAAYFGAAERFGNAGRGVMGGVSVAMLPRMTRAETDPSADSVRRTISIGIAGAYVLGGGSLIVLAPVLVPWYLGPGFAGAVPIAQLIGLALCAAGGSAVLSLRAAAAHRFAAIARVTTIAALTHLALIGPAAHLWGGTGAAATVLLSDLLLFVLFGIDHLRLRHLARGADPLPEERHDHVTAAEAATALEPPPEPVRHRDHAGLRPGSDAEGRDRLGAPSVPL
ncbi:lipopolysaccharide biosynthesis protein [Brachybacterium muris]|uniref:Polysaccharide biosynthesis protein n=1 Tax=Brachybacterium muris UCD-AY4 TaxID=1249481 RepID=A0A022KUP6_9MICO|nr:lipopolysaccharide biosynthesis protein [Brachybacterium muris]EYT49525.1 hypothetical protein D641_0107720 [Brachybacterium muris UCD-AY4]